MRSKPSARSPRTERYRHCMVVHAYYPQTETRVQREAEALVEAGFRVDVICLRDEGEPARERYRGVDVHRLPVRIDKRGLAYQLLSYVRFLVRASTYLARLDGRERFRSVQIHNLPDFLVFCAVIPKLRGAAIILDLHDLMPEFVAGRFGERRPWLDRAIRWQERVACRFADHVITVSDHWREALIERGVPADRCSVVMNVADERIFAPRPPRPSDGELRLVYHGTVTHRYGLDLAIRAVAMARAEVRGIRLLILGQGDAMPELHELRRTLALQDVVDLRDGYVVAAELPDVLADVDVGVVPYRADAFTDGLLPTKLMEYAAMGIPSIAARTSAIARYFGDDMVASFEPGNHDDLARCIVELATSEERRRELIRGAERFSERYNWSRIGREYTELVRAVGGAPSRLSLTTPPPRSALASARRSRSDR